MRRKFLFGLIIAAVLLALFFRGTDFDALGEVLSEARLMPLLLVFGIQMGTFVFRAFRWRLLLGPLGTHIPLSSLFNITSIGFMINNFVPRGAGEIVRAYLLDRRHGTSVSAAFATVFLERLFDFLVVLGILGVLLTGFELPLSESGSLSASRLRAGGWVVTGISVLIVGVLTLIYSRSSWVLSWTRWILSPLPERFAAKLLGLLEMFIQGLSSLRSARALAGVIVHSVLMWMALLATFPLVLYALGIDLPISASMLLLVLSVFSMFVPSPGAVGTMHIACQEGLKAYGVTLPVAKAAAIGLHASSYLPVLVLGLICLHREGLRFSQLEQAARSDGS